MTRGKRIAFVHIIFIAFAVAVLVPGCGKKKAEEAKVPEWSPVYGKIMTRWASEIRPDSVHQDYPRPQMERAEWLNLNGLWEYAVRPAEAPEPENFDGHILVPFPIESALSGVRKPVGKENRLWYKRTFQVPKIWYKKRVLLNFEAVDWETRVWVNGREAGSHRGGYDPFVFDITDHLKKRGEQRIVVSVWDPVDEGTQPRGKQVKNPRGIWYSSVTGIWATVWLEPVPETYISGIEIRPDVDKSAVLVKVRASDAARGLPVELSALDEGGAKFNAEGKTGEAISIPLANPRLWSPDSPFLYGLTVTLKARAAKNIDTIESYFGLRKISLGTDEKGVLRLFLNNAPLFQFGPLDQGWWPDGLYAVPSDAGLRYDIEILKELGFNMMRKHVKVEPRRFYYWCDKLGLMVWQDMPSGDAYVRGKDPDIQRTEESAREFEQEFSSVIKTLFNHPSIVMWVCFNEGWGQFDTPRIVDWVRSLDSTRLVNAASGWADRRVGDVVDVHAYHGPAAPANEPGRAAVLGEFGGLGLPLRSHTWQDEANWGYRSYTTPEELTKAYLELIKKLAPMVERGLSAAVYTQTTDVEIEVNGLMTYDRAVIKMDRERISKANRSVYLK
jgi:beta-galactosidase/beta-glucuronidase